MANGASPVTIEAFDDNNNQLFGFQVPFTWRVNVQELLEQAYILNQTVAQPDPFQYTLEYFGYSQSAQFPGFLGYELESINGFQTGGDFFWSLSVNGNLSQSGIDTTYPNPGATVTLQFASFATAPAHAATQRARTIQGMRMQRSSKQQDG